MQGCSWYNNNLSLSSPDVIHQVLAFGTLHDLQALKKKLGANRLREIFLNNPKKIYNPRLLNFIKNYFLDINEPINDNKYLKSTPRITG